MLVFLEISWQVNSTLWQRVPMNEGGRRWRINCRRSLIPSKFSMFDVVVQFSLFLLRNNPLFKSCTRQVSYHHVFLPISLLSSPFPFSVVEEPPHFPSFFSFTLFCCRGTSDIRSSMGLDMKINLPSLFFSVINILQVQVLLFSSF